MFVTYEKHITMIEYSLKAKAYYSINSVTWLYFTSIIYDWENVFWQRSSRFDRL